MYFSPTCWTYIWIRRRLFAFIFFLCYTFIRRLDNVFVNWKIPFLVIGVVETGVFWFHLFVCKTTAFLYLSWILWTPLSVKIGWVEFLFSLRCDILFSQLHIVFLNQINLIILKFASYNCSISATCLPSGYLSYSYKSLMMIFLSGPFAGQYGYDVEKVIIYIIGCICQWFWTGFPFVEF